MKRKLKKVPNKNFFRKKSTEKNSFRKNISKLIFLQTVYYKKIAQKFFYKIEKKRKL